MHPGEHVQQRFIVVIVNSGERMGSDRARAGRPASYVDGSDNLRSAQRIAHERQARGRPDQHLQVLDTWAEPHKVILDFPPVARRVIAARPVAR